jgi:hypothetical protein
MVSDLGLRDQNQPNIRQSVSPHVLVPPVSWNEIFMPPESKSLQEALLYTKLWPINKSRPIGSS